MDYVFSQFFKYQLAMAVVCESPTDIRENKQVSLSQSKVNQCAA